MKEKKRKNRNKGKEELTNGKEGKKREKYEIKNKKKRTTMHNKR